MSADRRIGTLVLLLAVLGGCGKDKAVGPKPNEITGAWRATMVEYVSKAAPGTRVDLIAAGDTLTLTINSDGSIIQIRTPLGGSPDTTTGTWELTTDIFKVFPTGMPFYWAWDVSLSGNTLTLTGADMEYDFNDDNVPEQADQNMVLIR